MSIIIVGGSVAGVRTAQALRSQGCEDAIVIVEAERRLPYDKPPLSKDMLLPGGAPEPVPLLSVSALEELSVDLRLGTRATDLDVPTRTLRTDGGDLHFDTLVIATGVHPRTLPRTDCLANVHTLRTADDARALRAALHPAARIVVVGAGFIGAEFAAAARAHGCAVDIVEPQEVPFAHILGREVGIELAAIHFENGARLHAGVGVADMVTVDGRAVAVRLTDGRELPCDLVLVGIGATPATTWLESSGLPISDGVLCNENLEVEGFQGIYAAGDVARWRHALYRTDVRIEHWTNANDHAAIIAAGVMGGRPPSDVLPYVWSDQYGHKIQIIGRPIAGEVKLVSGTVAGRDLLALYATSRGTLVGAVVVDDPRLLMKCRKAIKQRAQWSDLRPTIAGSSPAAHVLSVEVHASGVLAESNNKERGTYS